MKGLQNHSERYARFMGSWTAGAVIGEFVGTVVSWILMGYFLHWFFIKDGFWKVCLKTLFGM